VNKHKKSVYVAVALSAAYVTAACASPEAGKTALKAQASAHRSVDASGEAIGRTCAGCHALSKKNYKGFVPVIAGMEKDKIVEKMKAFKAGTAKDVTIMDRIAKGYSDAEIEAVAAYYAKMKH